MNENRLRQHLLLAHSDRSVFGGLDDDVEDYSCHSNFELPRTFLSRTPLSTLLQQRSIQGRTAEVFDVPTTNRFIPNTFSQTPVQFDSRVYNGQFSPDGLLYYSSSQNKIKVYDTSDIFDWELQHEIICRNIHWTVTDIDLSPCQQFIVYASMGSRISLVNLSLEPDLENKYGVSLNYQNTVHEQFDLSDQRDRFGIGSLSFNGDGNLVVAGTNRNSVEIYDLIKRKKLHSVINAHSDDVNSVCFANRDASNVIFTGSDDTSIKVWDLRTMRSRSVPEGVLIGHREGITYVTSKEDGYQLISNGKDQTMKLWDIRRMSTYKDYRSFRKSHRYQSGFDYRWQPYPLASYRRRLAADSSLLTFRGHEVLQTCIRCYYSPLHSTGQRFVYTGSNDGHVWVYDTVTGNSVADLAPSNGDEDQATRDVSWHPCNPAIAATSFSGTVGLYYYADCAMT